MGIRKSGLGDYLRNFRVLLEQHGFDAAIYGRFGDGCVHAKIGFDHTSATGVAAYRRFVEDAADLVVSYNGSRPASTVTVSPAASC